jgi:hypothetical protein
MKELFDISGRFAVITGGSPGRSIAGPRDADRKLSASAHHSRSDL